ncbi:DUF2304 domain-containing protein [Candidatus Uhrbacteria bacterium]|nr:DUF2304 domain-containing protein [Candidatus Uhrbacteria bacterium]
MLMRWLLLVVAVGGMGWVIRRFRQQKMQVGTFLLWLMLWSAVAVVAIVPDMTSRIAGVLGIGRGADVVVYTAIVLLLVLVLRLSVRIEQLDRAITRVVRELALRDGRTHPEE